MTAYRLLISLFSPLILAHLLWKSLRLKQMRFLSQRLGYAIDYIPQNCIWFHCASVGEVNAVLTLVHTLRQRHPEHSILITTNTTTGAEIVARQQQNWLFHAYLPMDWVSSTARFCNTVNPCCLFIMETELWPNLVDYFYQQKRPICIINARLSKKTLNANAWVRSVYKTTLERISHIYARSETDRKLYVSLGASTEQVSVLGNMKFSASTTSTDNRNQQLTTRDYVVIASSHENEEQLITECWLKLKRKELLVIAPRHPDRSGHILSQLVATGTNIAVRSRNDKITDQTQIYLLDTVGELSSWFSNARVVVMAGSFTHRGGHNILEPAHFARAIICGPHMESFIDEMEVMKNNDALLQVNNMAELASALQTLLDEHDARRQLENNAADAVAQFANITTNYADSLNRYITDLT